MTVPTALGSSIGKGTWSFMYYSNILKSDRSAVINVERSSKQDTASTFIFDLTALVDIAGVVKSAARRLTRSPPITST